MKIVLLRHGKPETPDLGKLTPGEFQQWINAYNHAHLNLAYPPTQQVIEIAQHCNIVVCSHLQRSLESARLLGVKQIHYSDALFRELEMPCFNFPAPRSSPAIWSVLNRILWFMGYGKNCESVQSARERAGHASDMLHHNAIQNKSVLFVGHSLLNRFIAKKLIGKGWCGSTRLFSQYWEMSVFEYPQ